MNDTAQNVWILRFIQQRLRRSLLLTLVVGAACKSSVPPTSVPLSGLDERPDNSMCVAPKRPDKTSGTGKLVLRSIYEDLELQEPIFMQQLPGDNKTWWVIERAGFILRFEYVETASGATQFADLSVRVNAEAGAEAGLLGMAIHPKFAQNGYVYLSYTGYRDLGAKTGLRSYVSRFSSSDRKTLDVNSEQVVLSVDQPYSNHNGGHIMFGPDGYLYIGFGDGGSGGDPQGYGQSTRTFLGKILRVDVDGVDAVRGTKYRIPSDNPYATAKNCQDMAGSGCPEIYALGMRNPWRWSFDRATGKLWAGDVGQGSWEEIDIIVRGGNYGWNIREGAHCYRNETCDDTGLIDPVAEYPNPTEGVSVTGGYVYRGNAIASLVGTYLYGDFGSGKIWSIKADGAAIDIKPTELMDTDHNIASFAEDAVGEIYLLDYYAGKILKLVAEGGAQVPEDNNTIPNKLSETGCVDRDDATKPSPGLIPYDINAALWSDGADKTRGLALPDGKTIHIEADGDWTLPIGSVLVKTFWLNKRRIETRLFVRHDDGDWAGYSYEWNDAQTDAQLLPDAKVKQIGEQRWYFPSRNECLTCHTAAAGRTLGLETQQLNRNLIYPNGRTANQIATLAHIKMFEQNPTTPYAALPSPDSTTATTTQRARAYLHANCANCHRPQGITQATFDVRFATALTDTSLCNAPPTQSNLGNPAAKLLVPGQPQNSLLTLRMRNTGKDRMPPLASHVIDTTGSALIEKWIKELKSTDCPKPN